MSRKSNSITYYKNFNEMDLGNFLKNYRNALLGVAWDKT